MKSSIDHVIYRELTRNKTEYNAIYYPYDGFFENLTAACPVMRYCPYESLIYEWPSQSWPDNIDMLPQRVKYVPNRIDIDLVIANWRKDQAIQAGTLAATAHIPFMLIDHELPLLETNQNVRRYVNSNMPKDTMYVVPNEMVMDEWCFDDNMRACIVPYGFELTQVENRACAHEVLVVGEYHPHDGMLKAMMECHPEVMGLGYNPGMNSYKDLEEIKTIMLSSRICISVSAEYKPPFFAMLAASCGCAVITNETRWTREVFGEDGENAVLVNHVNDFKKRVKSLLANPDDTDQMIQHCSDMMIRDYNPHTAYYAWLDVLKTLSKRTYVK